MPVRRAGSKTKVGILTYHRAINYGAVLQAYALKHFLEANRCDAEVLNYYNVGLKKALHSRKARLVSLVWKPVADALGKGKKIRQFQKFQKQELGVKDALIANASQLQKYIASEGIHAVVVGSDQVWNPNINGRDAAFVLGFPTDAKKIAYAASFGAAYLKPSDAETMKPDIAAFDAVSLREKTGQALVQSLCNRVAPVVVDPVFLPETDFWTAFAGKRLIPEPYVFCYVMPGCPKVEQTISDIAHLYKKQHNAKVVYVGRKEYKRFFPDGTDYVAASPQQFVNYLLYADLVVTNSFHGTAFSTILSKKFYSLINTSEDATKSYGSRISDLLGSLGLDNRLVCSTADVDFTKDIEYADVQTALSPWRQASKQFLLDALEASSPSKP